MLWRHEQLCTQRVLATDREKPSPKRREEKRERIGIYIYQQQHNMREKRLLSFFSFLLLPFFRRAFSLRPPEGGGRKKEGKEATLERRRFLASLSWEGKNRKGKETTIPPKNKYNSVNSPILCLTVFIHCNLKVLAIPSIFAPPPPPAGPFLPPLSLPSLSRKEKKE